MGIRFAAKVDTRKRSIIPAGMSSDSTQTQVGPRIDGGFGSVQPNSTGLDPERWANDRKKGRSQGERPREEILLLLHCFVPQCGTTQESRIPSTMSTINYMAIVNIS